MSYTDPIINANNTTPIGLDVPIQSVQAAIAAITWISKSFGRAYEFKQKDAEGKIRRIPKAYEANGEYINVLPNDSLFKNTGVGGSSFIVARNGERYESPFKKYNVGNSRTAELELIVWCDLKVIDSTKDYIYGETLKRDVERALSANPYVFEITEWEDESADIVFKGYDLIDGDNNSAYLQYPFYGFRVVFTVKYDAPC